MTINTGAPTSEGVYYISTFNFTPVDPNRPTYIAPNLPGNDWEAVYAGVCVDEANRGGAQRATGAAMLTIQRLSDAHAQPLFCLQVFSC